MKKKFLTLSLVGILSIGAIIPTYAQNVDNSLEKMVNSIEFKDLESDKWYTEPVVELVEKGILKGHDGLIRPNDKVTRAEYAQMLYNIQQEKGLLDIDGTDVEPDAWYFDAMQAAITFGIIRGDGYDSYKPNNLVTREEAFVMTARAFQIGGPTFTKDGEEIVYEDLTINFKDHSELSNWAKTDTNSLLLDGILKGNQDKKLLPKDHITRAEIASIIKDIKEVKEMPKVLDVKLEK